MGDYAVKFWTLSADGKWNDTSLGAVFVQGLTEKLKDELAARDDPPDLTSLVSLAIRLDNRLRGHRRQKMPVATGISSQTPTSATAHNFTGNPVAHPASSPVYEEPLQLGRTKLSPGERLRWMRAGECLYYGKSGHLIATCPTRPKDVTCL